MKKTWLTPVCRICRCDPEEKIGNLMNESDGDGAEFDFEEM